LSNNRESGKLEDPFNYNLLITHKNLFNSVKHCKSPLSVSYPYTDITHLFFIYFNVIFSADILSMSHKYYTTQNSSNVKDNRNQLSQMHSKE